MTHFFYSLMSFVVALFFIILGAASVLMSWFSTVRIDVTHFLLENTIALTLFGIAFILIGLFMILFVLLNTRRHYYEFTVRNQPVQIDESIIQAHLQEYFSELFPGLEIPCRLMIKQNRLHVTADLPGASTAEREILMTKIKEELKDLFKNQFSYPHDYFLSISFNEGPTA